MSQPLADFLRPKSLDQVFGQEHILGKNSIIGRCLEAKKPLSMILWGPPGCGKTSVARLIAKELKFDLREFNAVFSGVADLKKLVQEIKQNPLFSGKTLLFVDEIHRFNKAQQDAFLPFIESGLFTLIGATAENPSFYLNNALLSRMRVVQLKSLNKQALQKIYQRFEEVKGSASLSDEAREYLFEICQGDGRYFLNLLENIQTGNSSTLTLDELRGILQKKAPLFDKGQDQHYNIISALHKSIRGSDPDAALYWFARAMEGGEDPLYIARRLIRMASEDIGMAEPAALEKALASYRAYEILGSPEGELALAQTVVYLALSPKSNAVYAAFGAAKELAEKTGHLNPPFHILNAPNKWMKQQGYGKNYLYDHDMPQGFSGQDYFPEGVERQQFYHPVERGFEREALKRLNYFKQLKEKNL